MPKLYFYILGAIALIAVFIAFVGPSLARARWVEQAKLVADSEAGKYEFAQAVDIDRDTAVVAAPFDYLPHSRVRKGTVHVYTRSRDTWALQAKLFVPETQAGNYSSFGFSVAIDGNTILVAASLVRDNPNIPVYFFTRSGETWSLKQAQLPLPHPSKTSSFINSVVISGDTAVAEGGRVYVFRRHSETGTWFYEAELEFPKQANDSSGVVAIDGNTIIVGGGIVGRGNTSSDRAAFVFVRDSATGSWSLQAELVPYSKDVGYRTTVAISGNTAVVGVPGENWDKGAAYVYERNSATSKWFQSARLVPNDVPPSFAYGFGGSVGIDGNTIVVGVSLEHRSSGGLQFVQTQKSVYVFERNSRTGRWSHSAKLRPQDLEQHWHDYGQRVSISGDLVMVAAPTRNNKFATSTAYIFKRVDSQKQSN